MKKVILGLIVVTIVVVGIWYYKIKTTTTPITSKSEKPLIKIGMNIPLSGEFGIMGRNAKGAAELALMDLDKSKLKYNYVLLFEDNGWDTRRIATVNQKFVNIGKVDAFISWSSKIGMITNPIAEEEQIINIGISSNANVAKGRYNFIYCTTPEKQAEKMVNQLKKAKVQKVALLTHIDQGAEAGASALKSSLDMAGIVHTEIKFNPSEQNPSLAIHKLISQGYDMYILLLYSPMLDIAIKRFKEMDDNAQLTSIEAFSRLENKNIVEGIWYVDAADVPEAYYEKFATYNQSDNFAYVGFAYDAVGLLVQAFEAADTKGQAVEELTSLKEYKGILGNVVQDENGIFSPDAVIKKVVNGKSILIGE